MSVLKDDAETTKGFSGSSKPSRSLNIAPTPVPTLTLAYHPAMTRMGERLALSELFMGRTVAISRQTPTFSSENGKSSLPLEDPFLSRAPFYLQTGGNGSIWLRQGDSRTQLIADGEPVRGEICFSPDQIKAGIVLQLASRIVLVLHEEIHHAGAAPSFGLVGASSSMRQVRETITRVADLKVPVLLRGESGTGKELVARALHRAGTRREQPFVSVNLNAIPPTLAASELFGAVKGAFTGSVQTRQGFFQRAHSGTLFLDEIGDISLDVQAMLLRVLETHEIIPVGGTQPIGLDVRLITATDSDLEEKVKAGGFRNAFLHRLAGYELYLPPLRERREDIGRLLLHFLSEELVQIGERHRLKRKRDTDEPWFPAEVAARLCMFHWPGNVRQLRNVIRQIAIGNRGTSQFQLDHHLEAMLATAEVRESSDETLKMARTVPKGIYRKPSQIGEEELAAALEAERWDLKATSRRLGISRASLYLLIRKSERVMTAGDLTAEEITHCYRECEGDVEAMVPRLRVSKKALIRRINELRLPELSR